MNARILLGVGLLLCLTPLAQSADRSGYGHCGAYGEKTLFRWPGQAPSEEEEEEQPLATDRPDFTEASSTVGRGRAQLEFGYTYSCDDEDGVRVRAHSFPETLLRVGMLAEWFEFRIQWNYGVERTTDAGVSSTISEPEDLYLGVKLWLTEQDGFFPEMALVPQMTVPTAPEFADLFPPLFPPTRAFGAGEVLPGVNWLYGWDVGEIGYIAGSTQVNRALDESGMYLRGVRAVDHRRLQLDREAHAVHGVVRPVPARGDRGHSGALPQRRLHVSGEQQLPARRSCRLGAQHGRHRLLHRRRRRVSLLRTRLVLRPRRIVGRIGRRHLSADFLTPGVQARSQLAGLLRQFGGEVVLLADVLAQVVQLHAQVVEELDQLEVARRGSRRRASRRRADSADGADSARRARRARGRPSPRGAATRLTPSDAMRPARPSGRPSPAAWDTGPRDRRACRRRCPARVTPGQCTISGTRMPPS